MNQFKLLVLILFAFLVAVFAVSNQQNASLYFFGRQVVPEISMVIIVLGSVLMGVVLTAILGFIYQTKLKKEISKLLKELNQLKEKEERLQLKIREQEEKFEELGIEMPEKNKSKETEQ
jgi:uncharacterized integral membrane protein